MSPSPYSGDAWRAGIIHFLSGKAISALLTFALLLWLVRLLSLPEYGAYASFVALLEISALVANLGLPWLTARYLPEFRLHAPGMQLNRFGWWIVGTFAAIRTVWSLVMALCLPWLLGWGGLDAYRDAALVYLGVLFAEGLARHLRDDVLGALMRQSAARASLIVRQAVIFAIIAPQVAHGSIGLHAVVVAELLASAIGLLIALLAVRNHLRAMRALPGESNWQAPTRRRMLATAAPMYAVGLLATAHETPVFLLILQRLLGIDAAAAFGFLRHLHQYAIRYLPARLLAGLVRPKLVASFVGGGGVKAVVSSANLASKLNLFVLMPALAFAAVHAELTVGLLSGGKFTQTGWLLFGLLLALVPQSERALLEVVAVTTGHSGLCVRASLVAPLALPLMAGMVLLGSGVAAAVVALLAGHLLFVVSLQIGLSRRIGYRPDFRGFSRLALGAIVASLITALVDLMLSAAIVGWSRIATGLGVSIVGFLVFARLVRPFTADERARLNRFLRRELFIW